MQRIIKHYLSGIVLLLLIVAGTNIAHAQNAGDLKFNEILVLNDSNSVDDFGMHSVIQLNTGFLQVIQLQRFPREITSFFGLMINPPVVFFT
jgi:hypothetical protein